MPRLWPGMWKGASSVAFPLPATAASNGVFATDSALQWTIEAFSCRDFLLLNL